MSAERDDLAVPLTRRDMLAVLAAMADPKNDLDSPSTVAERVWEKFSVEWRQEARRVS